jgi:hypothetical protein
MTDEDEEEGPFEIEEERLLDLDFTFLTVPGAGQGAAEDPLLSSIFSPPHFFSQPSRGKFRNFFSKNSVKIMDLFNASKS